MKDAAREAPALFRAWRHAVNPDDTQANAASSGRNGGLTLNIAEATLDWHGDGEWYGKHLLQDGVVIGRCSNDLAFLHLYHGDGRVSLEEAEALQGADGSEPGAASSSDDTVGAS